jgi:hypothetical protein
MFSLRSIYTCQKTELKIRWTVPFVPDLGSRDRDVVLVRRTISSGKPRGVKKLEWEWDGEGEASLRATWG